MMSLKKLLFMIALILVVAASFITIDWSKFFYGEAGTNDLFPDYVRRTKWFISLLCSLTVWLGARNSWNKTDWHKMANIFITTLLADTCLVLLSIIGNVEVKVLGIVIFFAAHFLLIKRNLHGAKKLWIPRNIISAVVILLISSTFLIGILRPILVNQLLLFIFGIVYILILSTSLWAAWCTQSIGYLPEKSSRLTTIGLTCFYLCDLTVIFSIATSTPEAVMKPLWVETIFKYPAWNAIRYMAADITWIFYTPALLLLALSVYKSGLTIAFDGEK